VGGCGAGTEPRLHDSQLEAQLRDVRGGGVTAPLRQAFEKERELNELKSRFVSMASHEFRTPLSTVLSSASLLTKYKDAEDQPKRERHIEKIKASVKQLNDILEDFLSLGKLDEGKVAVSVNEFSLNDLIQDVIDEMKGLAKDKQKIVYSMNYGELIATDKKLLRNVLINLISNAIKFSGEDSSVWVNSNVNNGTVYISVKDEGIGISDDDKIHLFSSFFRGKNVLNIQGTGLGLHIVKRYMDLLDGEVDLESQLGKGTTITIKIPIKHPQYGKNDPGN